MCLIVLRPEFGANLDEAIIQQHRKQNPDGFGLAWRDQNAELHYHKFGPDEWDGFYQMLKLVDGTDHEYVAHWRKATHGKPCQELSHPFPYVDNDEGLVLVFHNGVIPITVNGEGSDTSTFTEEVLANLASRWWTNQTTVWLVEKALNGSRMLVMTPNETTLLNESKWRLENGIAFSAAPLPPPKPAVYNTGTYTPATTVTKPATEHTDCNTSCDVPPAPPFKSAEESAQTLLLPETTGGTGSLAIPRPGEGELVLPEPSGKITLPAAGGPYTHRGHKVSVVGIDQIDDDGDYSGECFCQTCYATGYYFTTGPKFSFQLQHNVFDPKDTQSETVQAAVKEAQASMARFASERAANAEVEQEQPKKKGGSRARKPQQIGFVPPANAQPVPPVTITKVH